MVLTKDLDFRFWQKYEQAEHDERVAMCEILNHSLLFTDEKARLLNSYFEDLIKYTQQKEVKE